MTTTPTGSPPWLRTQSITDYGGDANKTDYLGIGVVNPKTDVSAAQFLRLVNDVAAFGRASPFCVLQFETCNQEIPATNPNVSSVLGMCFSYVGPYYSGGSPPTGYPTVSRVADDHLRVTFSSSYTDSFGVSGAFTVNGCGAVSVANANIVANAYQVSDTIVDVYTIDVDTGSAPAVEVGINLTVW